VTTNNLIIAQEQPSDWIAVHAIHSAAFGRTDEADLVEALRQGDWAEISLVARYAGEVVGHVLFSRLEAPIRALALAPVAVRPDRQCSGVGSGLIRKGLKIAAEQGWECVFVLGDPAYYERFGFSQDAARGYDCIYAGDYFMAVNLRPHAVTSGQIRYAPPFGALA